MVAQACYQWFYNWIPKPKGFDDSFNGDLFVFFGQLIEGRSRIYLCQGFGLANHCSATGDGLETAIVTTGAAFATFNNHHMTNLANPAAVAVEQLAIAHDGGTDPVANANNDGVARIFIGAKKIFRQQDSLCIVDNLHIVAIFPAK